MQQYAHRSYLKGNTYDTITKCNTIGYRLHTGVHAAVGAQIVLERHVIAVPRHNVVGREEDASFEQLVHELLHHLKRAKRV
jgi:uncharacterized membrane protein YagU involved in acid resistance